MVQAILSTISLSHLRWRRLLLQIVAIPFSRWTLRHSSRILWRWYFFLSTKQLDRILRSHSRCSAFLTINTLEWQTWLSILWLNSRRSWRVTIMLSWSIWSWREDLILRTPKNSVPLYRFRWQRDLLPFLKPIWNRIDISARLQLILSLENSKLALLQSLRPLKENIGSFNDLCCTSSSITLRSIPIMVLALM